MKVELKVGTPHGEYMTVFVVSHLQVLSPWDQTYWRSKVCELPGWTGSNIAFVHVVGPVVQL